MAQNEAETSRLMKAMEHLENSMIHNEDALIKLLITHKLPLSKCVIQ